MTTHRRIVPSPGPRRLAGAAPLLALVGACSFDAVGLGSAGGTTESGGAATTTPETATSPATDDTSPTGPTTAATGTGTSAGVTSTSTTATSTTATDTTATSTTAVDTTAGPGVCGDGMLDLGEACDDGNQSNEDTCTITCVEASCGDGFVQPGEACDDANDDDGDLCSNTCQPGSSLVFVTAEVFSGDLGGLDGADKICQSKAEAAKLGGTWKAWLSTDNPADGPAQRFTQSAKPYRLVTGLKIADNWATLIDGSLDAPIDVTETGAPGGMTDRVWTNTNTMGTYATNSDCSAWSPGNNGTYGIRTRTDGAWTNSNSSSGCGDKHHLYCFQQQ